jgi:hypothetical protein
VVNLKAGIACSFIESCPRSTQARLSLMVTFRCALHHDIWKVIGRNSAILRDSPANVLPSLAGSLPLPKSRFRESGTAPTQHVAFVTFVPPPYHRTNGQNGHRRPQLGAITIVISPLTPLSRIVAEVLPFELPPNITSR